jgi:hypothetical protein
LARLGIEPRTLVLRSFGCYHYTISPVVNRHNWDLY